jgi:hypothetical protein
MAGSPWPWTLTVITVPQATVLVRYVAPTEVWEWPVGFHAQALERIDTLWADRAQVLPIVAKVEHVRELLAQIELPQFHAPVVQRALSVVILDTRDAEVGAVGTSELMQVAAIPAREGVVDGRGELGEGMTPRSREDPAGSRPEHLAVASNQIDADRQPCPGHVPRQLISRQPPARHLSDERLKTEIARVHRANFGVYGIEKVWRQLNREVHKVDRDRVARAMDDLELSGVVRGKRKRATYPARVWRRSAAVRHDRAASLDANCLEGDPAEQYARLKPFFFLEEGYYAPLGQARPVTSHRRSTFSPAKLTPARPRIFAATRPRTLSVRP